MYLTSSFICCRRWAYESLLHSLAGLSLYSASAPTIFKKKNNNKNQLKNRRNKSMIESKKRGGGIGKENEWRVGEKESERTGENKKQQSMKKQKGPGPVQSSKN